MRILIIVYWTTKAKKISQQECISIYTFAYLYKNFVAMSGVAFAVNINITTTKKLQQKV